ncbi:MAG: hypothetical protein ABID63_10720 [Pseudomonadota bacterium]
MLAGTKPLALFYDVLECSDHLPDAAFAPHVASGKIIRHAEILDAGDYKIRYLLFALPGEAWRIEAAMQMNRNLCAGTVTCHETDTRRMGELLGYNPADIDLFITNSFADKRKSPSQG